MSITVVIFESLCIMQKIAEAFLFRASRWFFRLSPVLLEYYMTQKLFLKLTAETFWAFIVITKIFIGYKLVLQTSTFVNQSQTAYYWLLWSLIHQQKWRTLVTGRKQQVTWTVRERCLLFKIMGGEGVCIPKITNNLTSPYFLSSCIYV